MTAHKSSSIFRDAAKMFKMVKISELKEKIRHVEWLATDGCSMFYTNIKTTLGQLFRAVTEKEWLRKRDPEKLTNKDKKWTRERLERAPLQEIESISRALEAPMQTLNKLREQLAPSTARMVLEPDGEEEVVRFKNRPRLDMRNSAVFNAFKRTEGAHKWSNRAKTEQWSNALEPYKHLRSGPATDLIVRKLDGEWEAYATTDADGHLWNYKIVNRVSMVVSRDRDLPFQLAFCMEPKRGLMFVIRSLWNSGGELSASYVDALEYNQRVMETALPKTVARLRQMLPKEKQWDGLFMTLHPNAR